MIGRQLASYRLERLIGKGGMAQVYYGTDVKLNRPVAVKILDSRSQENPDYARRFVQEASAVSTWRHEHIIQVYYANDENGLYYFAMEYIDGLDLAELLRQYAAEGELMPHEDVLRIGRAIAEALDYAHARGVIHRDVKPGNVLVSRENRVVLTDFGLALDMGQGSLGQIFGTPHYIAPEQARRSADATPLSDLYSFGVLLYEMLTGAVPFDDVSPTNLALQHLTEQPPEPRSINPQLNAETEKVLLKALSKAPEQRYPSGKALMDALEKALKKRRQAKELPPIPAGVTVVSGRVLSGKTVAQRVAHADVSTLLRPAFDATIPQRKQSPAVPRKKRFFLRKLLWALLGSCSMLGVAGVILLVLSNNLPESADEIVVVVETPEVMNGRPVLLMYNADNFYLKNVSEDGIDVSQLRFEAVNSAVRFSGVRWARTKTELTPDFCMSLEYFVDNSNPMREQCSGREAYVELSPASDFVFWMQKNDAVEFRVLWNGQEAGRCPTIPPDSEPVTCEVYLP